MLQCVQTFTQGVEQIIFLEISKNDRISVPDKKISTQCTDEVFHHTRGLPKKVAYTLQKALKDPDYLLDSLITSVKRNLVSNGKPLSVRNLFITSPWNIAEKLQNYTNYKGYKIISTVHTRQFLERYRDSCEIIGDIFGDILSTLEKEI